MSFKAEAPGHVLKHHFFMFIFIFIFVNFLTALTKHLIEATRGKKDLFGLSLNRVQSIMVGTIHGGGGYGSAYVVV